MQLLRRSSTGTRSTSRSTGGTNGCGCWASTRPRCIQRPPECFGPEAAAFTASLLPPGSEIRLERDIVGRDHYGRLLAHVYRRDDGLLVNEAILREGYAQPLTIEPNRVFAERYVAATVAAERDGLGLWRACAGR